MLKLYFAKDLQYEAEAMRYMARWQRYQLVQPEQFVPNGVAAWHYGWCADCEQRKWVAGLHSLCSLCRDRSTNRVTGFAQPAPLNDQAEAER